VAIVNEAFVRQFDLGDDVIGRRMRRGRLDDAPFNIEIVGVVRDAKYSELKGPTPAQFFQPYRETPTTSLNFYVRTTGEPSALMAAVPSVVARVDSTLPVADLRTMESQVWDRSTPERLLATVSSWVAALAAILAAIGLYAVLSYTVARRRREFGIRLALGARPANVRGMVVAHVARMSVVGVIVGGTMALVLAGVSGTQPAIFGGAIGVIAAVIAAAAIIPARRAASVEPASALRAD
jgi:ABC-type antimicrobial peptide transport system permease subunit